MKRQDLALEQSATERGWTAERNVMDTMEPVPAIPAFPLTFTRGNYHTKDRKTIWKTKKVWTCADVIVEAPNFVNHRTYPTLDEALDNES